MASPTQIRPNRLLRELLQQEQEPFILEAYLLERGYSRNSLKSELGSGFSLGRALSKSASCNLQRSKKGVMYSSKFLKSVYKKLVLINKSLRIKKRDYKDGAVSVPDMSSCKQDTQSERFSSASSTTLYNSCPESDKEGAMTSLHDRDRTFLPSDKSKSCNLRKDEAPTDRKLRRRCIKESPKHSSVTAGKTSHEGFPTAKKTKNTSKRQEEDPSVPKVLKPKRVTEDSILSASLWELLVCSATDKTGWLQVSELRDLVHSNASHQWFMSKRVVQQNKQLLFDCVRELIENNGRRKEYSNEFLGSEEIGKLICEKIKEWGKQSGCETNIDELLNLDFEDSVDEWNDFKPQKKEFAMAIGDDILEELRSQLVLDMLDSLASEMLSKFSV